MNILLRVIKKTILLSLTFIVFSVFSKNSVLAYDLTRTGVLSANETWSGTVLVTGDVTVPAGIILTIQPGTVVQFAANSDDQHSGDYPTKAELIINGGNLIAQGTATQPITFTSNSVTPMLGDWGQIKIMNPSSQSTPQAVISYSDIGYSIHGINSVAPMTISNNIIAHNSNTAITQQWAGSTITGNTITENGGDAIYLSSSISTIDSNQITNNSGNGIVIFSTNWSNITHNTITRNSGAGILIPNSGYSLINPHINYNIISGNTTSAISNLQFMDIDATNNDWGTSDPAQIFNAIYDFNHNHDLGLVAFSNTSVIGEQHISGNVTWSGTQLITSHVWINQGATLTIQAGTKVKFAGFYGIFNQGTLIVQGTSINPVIFTSNAVTPAPGDWAMIKFNYTYSTGSVNYAQINYARNGVYALASNLPSIKNSVISNSQKDGLILDFNTRTNLYYNTITNNGGNGVFSGNGSVPKVNCSNLSGNSGYSFRLGDWFNIDATYNYWGTTDPTVIDQLIYDHYDYAPYGIVDFSKYQTVPTTPLQLIAPSDQTSSEGAILSFNLGSFTNNCSLEANWAVDVDWGDGSSHTTFNVTTQGALSNQSHTYISTGIYTVAVKITNSSGASDSKNFKINVVNVPPTVGTITAPTSPVQLGNSISTSANFSDPGIVDTHTAIWDWGDGTTSAGTVSETNGLGTVAGSHTYTAVGVYTVTLTVIDKDGGTGQNIFQYVVIFSSTAGFVTGSGTIDSPTGAYIPNPAATGKAILGFSIKYLTGYTVPEGQTKFSLSKKIVDLSFTSTAYQWLVVSGAKAMFQGTGTVNGGGNYTFLVSVIDGQISGSGIDTFRIKITDNSTGNVIYDNQMGALDTADPTTPLTSGSIVIH